MASASISTSQRGSSSSDDDAGRRRAESRRRPRRARARPRAMSAARVTKMRVRTTSVAAAPGLGERREHDLQAAARLAVRVGRRIGVAGHDRRRAADVDVGSHADGARVADRALPGGCRTRRCGAPWVIASRAVEALRQIEEWACAACCCGRRAGGSGVVASHGDGGARLLDWASVTKPVDRAGRARCGRGGRGRPRRAGRAARIERAASARARLGAAVRGGRRRIAPARAGAGSTRTPGFEALAEHVAARRGDAVRRSTCDEAVLGAARHGGDELRGSPAAGIGGSLDDLLRSPASCSRPRSSRRRRSTRRRRSRSPGSTACCPTTAA